MAARNSANRGTLVFLLALFGATACICEIETSPSLPEGTVGHQYLAGLRVSGWCEGGTWSSGDLPPGIVLHRDGQLSGAPRTPGTFNFTATFEEDVLSSNPVVITRSFFITIRAQAG